MTILCNKPTTNFRSGRELLLHYDTNNDKYISQAEAEAAMVDHMQNPENLTMEEAQYVVWCFGAGGSIDKVCPSGAKWVMLGLLATAAVGATLCVGG